MSEITGHGAVLYSIFDQGLLDQWFFPAAFFGSACCNFCRSQSGRKSLAGPSEATPKSLRDLDWLMGVGMATALYPAYPLQVVSPAVQKAAESAKKKLVQFAVQDEKCPLAE
jgi:hypothetical protein